MKNVALTVALLLGFNASVQSATTCTNDDLTGEWSGKYIVSTPAFVGTCTIVFDNNMVPSGKCDNFNEGESSDVFDGVGSISKRCDVKSRMTFNNGLKMDNTLKMAPDKQYMSGTFVSNMNGKITRAKVTFKKTGELSCQVIPHGE